MHARHGHDNPPAPVPADTYADDYSTGYDAIAVGSAIDLIVGQLQYQSLDGTYVLDDDGVDLFNMIPSTVVEAITITNGPTDQIAAILAGAQGIPEFSGSSGNTNALLLSTVVGDPVGGLKAAPTQVDVQLVPVTGGDFLTQIGVNVQPLAVPKTIDLSAPSQA